MSTLPPVEVFVTVNATPDNAFAAFSERITEWWPKTTHALSPSRHGGPPQAIVMERWENGRIFEITPNGEHLNWGQVLRYAPPYALRLMWHVGRSPEQATYIDVTFAPTDDGRTGITLVHTGWEALGDEAQDLHGNYLGGWSKILTKLFAAFIDDNY